MRYELTDHEWAAIKPFLPNRPRGVPRVNDRRMLNGIFWVLRSGAPWRDLPENFGPYTTCYNRFIRWRRAWRVGPAHEAHDNRLVLTLLSALKSGAMLLADRGFDADWIRTFVSEHGAWANIPPRRNRTEPICFSRHLYRARNLVERFFNKIKQCRRVATRYDKLAANYRAFIQLASIRLWLRVNESAPCSSRKPADDPQRTAKSQTPSAPTNHHAGPHELPHQPLPARAALLWRGLALPRPLPRRSADTMLSEANAVNTRFSNAAAHRGVFHACEISSA